MSPELVVSPELPLLVFGERGEMPAFGSAQSRG